MKLFHLVLWRFALALIVIFTLWTGFFYMAVMEEVNDEIDDSLEDYSEWLIVRLLQGEEMPDSSNGSNNQYFFREVSEAYALSTPQIVYRDEMVYLVEKGEDEPARVLVTLFQTDDGYMELTVYTPTIEKMDLQKAILGWIIFLYVLLLLAILLIIVWVYRRNMKPLYTLLAWIDRYRVGHKNEPLDNCTSITEFHHLNETIMDFAERNEKLFEQQKLFIGNASHEMQTPLAICCNRLEMLMEDESLSERQLDELEKTHRTLENLTRMNRSLLLLCKIENGQYMDHQPMCLDVLAKRYVEDFQEVYAYQDIRVETQWNASFCVEMNDSLASVLVTNLLKNAFVHNEQGGLVRIESDESKFLIGNAGGEPLDGTKVFERFYQGKKKKGSTGLGLALADTICKANRLCIRYYYQEGMHFFEISKSFQIHSPSLSHEDEK